ncbi:unnamed protein product, partial [Ranitomeya imitator]
MELLSCPSCQHTLWEPVTLACGHTFCKKCLKGVNRCQLCTLRVRISGAQELRCNTLLASLLERCLNMEAKVERITRDLEGLIARQQYEDAGATACRGVVMAPDHVPLRILRSQVYLGLKQFPESLREAEVICDLQPQNPEGYYRKGMAFLYMEKKEAALKEFQRCLALNPHFTTARHEIEQILDDTGSSAPSSLEDFMVEGSQISKWTMTETSSLIAPLQAATIGSERCGNGNEIGDLRERGRYRDPDRSLLENIALAQSASAKRIALTQCEPSLSGQLTGTQDIIVSNPMKTAGAAVKEQRADCR